MIPRTDEDGTFNLLAAMIDGAVFDFNHGERKEKRQAAAFFRGERCRWICDAVGAKPDDIIKARLNGDPREMVTKDNKRRSLINVAKKYEYDGKTRTMKEWAGFSGVGVNTLRGRVRKYGFCKKVFTKGMIPRETVYIEHEGVRRTINQWAKKLNLTPMGFRARLTQLGICKRTFRVRGRR